MSLIEITDPKLKNNFNQQISHPLQTWEWAEFRELSGNKIIRLAELEKGKIKKSFLMTVHKIPFSSYAVGALIKGGEFSLQDLLDLKQIAKNKKIIFVKLEPNLVIKRHKIDSKTEREENLKDILTKAGAVPGKRLFTKTTFWIDLSKTEDQLLNSFHPKTRYNIRVALKHGVRVEEDSSDKAFARYLELTKETVERQKFYAHTKRYHKLMWETLNKKIVRDGQSPIARILTAKYKDKILTTWILFAWKDFLYYPYGASSAQDKHLMANNLIMWEAIKYGKKLGLKTFDLWGREPGKGFTNFKEGYNPEIIEFIGTWDLVIYPSIYFLYQIAEKIRWIILRLKRFVPLLGPKF